MLTDAIGTDESDDIKSYDVAWLEHLVGDVHQPLHATSRFTKNHPNGDAGGNLVLLCAAPCRDELHAYWDGLLGDGPMIEEIQFSETNCSRKRSLQRRLRPIQRNGWMRVSR